MLHLQTYSEYVWRPVGHERRVSAEEWWRKREYLWPRVATVARRRLATQASSACSERSFSKAGLICSRKRMMLKPEHVDALSLLGWHAMREKELLSKGNRLVGCTGRNVGRRLPWTQQFGRKHLSKQRILLQ